jgi:hypothetical protein
METEGIYKICNIDDLEIAKLVKDYEFVNCTDQKFHIDKTTEEVVFLNIPNEPKALDLFEKESCRILLIQNCNNKIIEYANKEYANKEYANRDHACIYFP